LDFEKPEIQIREKASFQGRHSFEIPISISIPPYISFVIVPVSNSDTPLSHGAPQVEPFPSFSIREKHFSKLNSHENDMDLSIPM
jgi:hypothetical protein